MIGAVLAPWNTGGRQIRWLSLLALAMFLGAGCDESSPRRIGAASSLVVGAGDSPLFALFGELDRRIERLNRDSGRRDARYYLDRWYPELRAVRDFVVDRRRLYALVGSEYEPDDPRLLVVDLERDRLLQTLELPPMPDRLLPAGPGQLIVGHGTPPGSGPAGRLTVLKTDHRPKVEVVGSVALAGAFVTGAASGTGRAYVLELTQHTGQGKKLVNRSALSEVMIAGRLRVVRRMPLPPGAREVALGPTGLLYISQASAGGALETDGTITVVDPGRWRVVDRLRQEMTVRRIVPSARYLLLNMISTEGECWLAVIDRAHQTVFDWRLDGLASAELVVAGDRVFTTLRRGRRLAWIDLRRLGGHELKLEPLAGAVRGQDGADGQRVEDRPGLLRTWVDQIRPGEEHRARR